MDKEKQPLPHPVELLAPARDLATAIAAIDHGADAVYMGGPALGARRDAANPVADIARAADYAHRFGARVYVTLNTIIYEDELEQARQLAWQLYRAGADALIVQDMALLEMELPPIALHASTQCDTRSPEKARFLQEAGFSQLVLARELTLDEIKAVGEQTSVPLEVFVHGALCVSYSGDCRASLLATGRSANRGECCQVCRWPFDLEDAQGKKLLTGRHLLSLKDMSRIDRLSDLLDAGASSLKIEGRLKDAAYVKTVVAAYRRALDAVIDANPDRYRRASLGRVEAAFRPDVSRVFNRGFTDYFLDGEKPAAMAEFRTPKWVGREIGRVVACHGRRLEVKTTEPLHNGDGLSYFDPSGAMQGFRVNRAEGASVFPASPLRDIRPGTPLYRNADKLWDDALASPKTAVRVIDTEMTLRADGGELVLEIAVAGGDGHGEGVSPLRAAASVPFEGQAAKTPQEGARRRVLEKLGDTEFRLASLADTLGPVFVAASVLADLRRKAVEALRKEIAAERVRSAQFPRSPQSGQSAQSVHPSHKIPDCNNVANSLARRFYRERGVEAATAAEVAMPPSDRDFTVMETRYCLRRELGCCLKTSQGGKLPSPLFITSQDNRFRLDFDCAACRMRVVRPKNQNQN